MQKRDISQLAVCKVEEETDLLPAECLRELYLNKTSEIVYVIKERKIWGIVCLGDVMRQRYEAGIRINRNFTSLDTFNIMKAHDIFRVKGNIHKIPVVNRQGELLGDYSRWDDVLYIERNYRIFLDEEIIRKLLERYENVYIIEPVDRTDYYYLQFMEYLNHLQIGYMVLHKVQIAKTLGGNNIYIFLNEDEKRGTLCLIQLLNGQDKENVNDRLSGRFHTYRDLLNEITWRIKFDRLGIEKPEHIPYYRIDDKATVFLGELEKKGVKCFCLYPQAYEQTDYGKTLLNEIGQRVRQYPFDRERPWPKKTENKEFYGELYEQEDYEQEIAQSEIHSSNREFGIKRNICGKYLNVRNGRRVTSFQPEQYEGTIYMLGPCTFFGIRVEDKYTIESCLQNNMNQQRIPVRVENYGRYYRRESVLDEWLREIDKYSENDIVIYLSRIGEAVGIDGTSLEEIFGKYHVPSEWFYNSILHCNHKAYRIIAQYIQEMIESYWSECALAKSKSDSNIKIDFNEIMNHYVYRKYISHYSLGSRLKNYNRIGAIVMNGNPFSKGHRYLVEHAMQYVEFLILFVVEEDVSLFPFEERFHMVKEGVKDLDNVMVVPSGEFILSRNTYTEYFTKQEDELVVSNAEYDLNIFADYIAKPLRITYRFAGEEPVDRITDIYNKTMKRILPQKGITFVEIPRIMTEEEIVSASRVRKYLEIEDYEKAFSLLPETTIQYIKGQM